MNDTIQLTIRGLDNRTKEALVKNASQQGISLNSYALKALKRSVGAESSEKRYKELKKFLSHHKIDQTDKEAFDEALLWSDRVSKEKQAENK